MRIYYFFSSRNKAPFQGVLAFDTELKKWLAHPPRKSFAKFKTEFAKSREQVVAVFKNNKLIKVVHSGRQLLKR